MDRHVISAEQLFGCDGDADPIEDMITMCLDDRLNARCGEANQKSPDLRLRARVEMRLRVLNDEYRTGSTTQCGDNDREAIGQSEPNASLGEPNLPSHRDHGTGVQRHWLAGTKSIGLWLDAR